MVRWCVVAGGLCFGIVVCGFRWVLWRGCGDRVIGWDGVVDGAGGVRQLGFGLWDVSCLWCGGGHLAIDRGVIDGAGGVR